MIWERQFVFAARAYLVTRRGDAAAAAASAMHHGAARIEGYTSASREECERIAWCGRETGGDEGEGEDRRRKARRPERKREREEMRSDSSPPLDRSPTPKGRPTA